MEYLFSAKDKIEGLINQGILDEQGNLVEESESAPSGK